MRHRIGRSPLLRSLLRFASAVVLLYASWLGMLIVHELGHVLHAVLSGGRVIDVHLPLLGFSQTMVHPNPHELFVVWGGPIWGAALPLLICGGFLAARRRVPQLVRFFAGFCLIANGTYIGVGWTTRAGDAGDLLRLNTPVAVMVVFGVISVAVGLWLWHKTIWLRLNRRERI